ncbi:hypothetical protein K2F45_00870 [Sphingobacterium siyangense]|uniref:hypothetical protein n=1 Tax=Sphingobacterium siyangense TaxID=459529 RepID=UPI00200D0EE6|nr:hypothetical protein [Sphingobacterium siyangense]UQA75598.1 hypothetical protein K2F45_00870 [Sphingobacterium siyangense]
MTYLYIFLFIAIAYALFRFFSSRKKKPTDVSMYVYYRFQDHPGQYSGSFRATHGALVFRGERFREDVNNIVVKDVRSTDSKVEIKLQQILVLPFKENENTSFEVSVRFRIGSDKAKEVDLTNYKVRIQAVINYQNGNKRVISTVLPMMGVYHNHPEKPGDFINK